MGHNRYFRSPLTTQERRATGRRPHNGIEEHEGYVVRVRAKRGVKTIPDAWCDLYVHKDKCWKGKRKTQYH